MDPAALALKLRWSYQKNRPELMALTRRLYPRFVFERQPRELDREIPVFNFHAVTAESFEPLARYLAENAYRTLTSDEMTASLAGARPLAPRSVALTFDDGWESLHTVAAPILRRYGLKGLCFLIAGLMAEKRADIQPDSEAGKIITWEEAREDSDVVDFQSHSMWHHRVCVSPRIVDFIHPGFDFYALRVHVPVLRVSGKDDFGRRADWGTPVYEYAPRLAARRRYYDDEELRRACVAHVATRGGNAFFERRGWRRELIAIAEGERKRTGERGAVESREEMEEAIRAELAESRSLIERQLPGHEVRAFCYPWFAGSEPAVEISKSAGYTSNHWGVLPGRRTNKAGDDPFHIVRIPPDYIWRLPGNGRRPLWDVLRGMFTRNAPGFLRGMRST